MLDFISFTTFQSSEPLFGSGESHGFEEGQLDCGEKSFNFSPFKDTGEVSKPTFSFLQSHNALPKDCEKAAFTGKLIADCGRPSMHPSQMKEAQQSHLLMQEGEVFLQKEATAAQTSFFAENSSPTSNYKDAPLENLEECLSHFAGSFSLPNLAKKVEVFFTQVKRECLDKVFKRETEQKNTHKKTESQGHDGEKRSEKSSLFSLFNKKDPLKDKERDSQKDGQGRNQEEKEEPKKPHEKKKKKVEAIAASASCEELKEIRSEQDSTFEEEKPILPAPLLPRLSLFSCYFMLDKLRLDAESRSYALSKDEIREIDQELNKTQSERIAKIKDSAAKEKQVDKWGILAKATALSLSITGVASGIALISMGVGAVAGAILVVSGLINIASQVMEVTGGWNKIAALLPQENPEKNRAVITWIQFGVTAFSLMLAAAAFIAGNVWSLKDSLGLAGQAAQGILQIANGIVSIGYGVTIYKHYNSVADLKEHEIVIAKLKALREDLMDLIENVAERMERMIEYFGETLALQKEMFKAEQMAWR